MKRRQTQDVIVFGIPKLPARTAVFVMPLLLSLFMSCLVSAISTLNSVGLVSDFLPLWLRGWITSWLVAFPTLLLVLPVVRRIVTMLVRAPDNHSH